MFFAASAYHQGTPRLQRRTLWEHFLMRDRTRELLRQIWARIIASSRPDRCDRKRTTAAL